MKKTAVILMLSLMGCLIFSGCGLLNKVKEDFDQSEGVLEDSIFDEPIVVMETPTDLLAVTNETKLITLYFADPLEEKLVVEEREVPKVTGIARATMEELIKGPVGLELEPTLPAGTKLLDINVREDGLAIVDFSSELIKGLPATATAEKLAVYSIVNTLTQFPTVYEVEMRVEGKKVDTLLGHMQIEDNLIRDTSFVK